MKTTVQPRPRTMPAWYLPEWPPSRHTSTPGSRSTSPSAGVGGVQFSESRSSPYLIGGDELWSRVPLPINLTHLVSGP